MKLNHRYLCNYQIVNELCLLFLKDNHLLSQANNLIIFEVTSKNNLANLACNLLFLVKIANNKEKFLTFLKNSKYAQYFQKVEIINNFLNFYCQQKYLVEIISKIWNEKLNFGRKKLKNKKINIEIISANPTGLLHIGHVRNGCLGTSLGKIFAFLGYQVNYEYYVNDSGHQIDLLASSVFYYYLQIIDPDFKLKFSENFYHGRIYYHLAKKISDQYQDKFKDSTIKDDIIVNKDIRIFFQKYSKNFFLTKIQQEIKKLKIKIDFFRYESTVYHDQTIFLILNNYQKNNNLLIKNNATFLKTTKFNDVKDRVLIKQDHSYTYLLPDIASHYQRIKTNKEVELFLDFVGADHHDYAKRMIISLKLLNLNLAMPVYKIIQMVKLKKNDVVSKISKRKGNIIFFKDLSKFLSISTINYMMVSKLSSSQLILDLDLLKQQANNNPIFYIHYACARIFQLFKAANFDFKQVKIKNIDFLQLNHELEIKIINKLHFFEFNLQKAALKLEPSIICNYLYELVKLFHIYYSKVKILNNNHQNLTTTRLIFIRTIQIIIKICLKLINVIYKQKMY